jgi:UDP-GlcNAc:undecaprenyl-phosphate GlcNAc-1-phosphate transferase
LSFADIITCGLAGFTIAFSAVLITLRNLRPQGAFQRGADLHHTHKAPVPRFGGLALAVAFLGVELLVEFFYSAHRERTPGRLVVVLSSLAMFGVGFWDDIKPLGAKRKLLAQILIALSVYYFGIGIQLFKIPLTEHVVDLGGWGVLITVCWLVAMTNLINLIDGVDGLAGGICLMLMILIVFVGHQNGHFELLSSGMVGALVAFLWFNFPPARIYLGDGGAYFLGFQIGLFSLVNSHKGTIFAALVAPLFVLALPIVDTGLAILRRGLRGLPIFRPDRRHIHHKLLGMGYSRRKAVLWLYGVTLVFLGMGLAAYWSRGQLLPILLGLATLVLLICAGRLRFSREWFSVGRVVGDSLAMRQEVQYALTLTRWLALEGDRCASIEELWEDLALAARKLSFTSIKLTLDDGERVWSSNDAAAEPTQYANQEFHGGRSGIIELSGPGNALQRNGPSDYLEHRGSTAEPAITDPRLFEIVSELLMEGWMKAVAKWDVDGKSRLRFDSKRTRRTEPTAESQITRQSAAPENVALTER